MAAGDLTTLEAVKRDLGITVPDANASLEAWIAGASAWIVSYCEQPILATDHTLVAHGNGGYRMVLPYSPVISISSLKIGGAAVTAGTPGALNDGYFLDSRGIITLRGLVFAPGIGNVEVAYRAGYTTVPAELERACVRIVGRRYRERERLGVTSKSIGGESISWMQTATDEDVLESLSGYKRVIPA